MRASEVVPGFTAENELEQAAIEDPELLAGLAWGEPRAGHPEGTVGAHVAELLSQLDRERPPPELRRALRFVALVHDSQKHRVQHWRPRTGENHHAMRARRLAERYTDDERLLTTVELHDRPYALWRKLRRTGRLDQAGFKAMLDRVADPALFLRFVELDGSSEGKNPEPIRWFRDELRKRGLT